MYLVRIAGEGELVVGQTRPGEFATVAPSAVITMPCAVLTRTAAMLWLNVAQTKRTIRAAFHAAAAAHGTASRLAEALSAPPKVMLPRTLMR